MNSFEITNIWSSTLSDQEGDRYKEARAHLREAFYAFRERAKALAAEIPQDLRDFTVHDITHIDALWEMADVITGNNYSVTPTESFILGGSFLLHDLGMGLAAYQNGMEELERDPQWSDTLISVMNNQFGNKYGNFDSEEIPDGVLYAAKQRLLRLRHAQKSSDLALTSWQDRRSDKQYYLIDDAGLRGLYGELIGKLAYSHWWPVSRLQFEFQHIIGAPVFCPREWTVDPIKLSCLLRSADVIHLDERRAPGFLRSLRKPDAHAREHWVFQEHLQKPYCKDERVVFTSTKAFGLENASAWWLCYDTLKSADRELREVDALLADSSRDRFACRGVAGADDATRMAEYIPTESWVPIDVKIHIDDVASVVQRLGGSELYGDAKFVFLRELLQNAADAVRARRILEDRGPGWGETRVAIEQVDGSYVLSVSDNGIGMSQSVLAGPFLDFGSTYWGSSLMLEEHPGLLSKGFSADGRYGIGFYSVFMVATKVLVVTRQNIDSFRDTRVLEFDKGLKSRPILRKAKDSEQKWEAGTTIKVWLRVPPNDQDGLLAPDVIDAKRSGSFRVGGYRRGSDWTLRELIGFLVPSTDVDIFCSENGVNFQVAVNAGDWLACNGEDLIKQCMVHVDPGELREHYPGDTISNLGQNLRQITDNKGRVLGRACLAIGPVITKPFQSIEFGPGVVTAGAFRAEYLTQVAGIILGRPLRVSRDEACPLASEEHLAAWATEQARLVRLLSDAPSALSAIALIVRVLGGDTLDLPIAQTHEGWVSYDKLISLAGGLERIVLTADYMVGLRNYKNRKNSYVINKNSIIVDNTQHGSWYYGWAPSLQRKSSHPKWHFYWATLTGLVIEAISQAWGRPLDSVLAASLFSDDEHAYEEVIGVKGKKSIKSKRSTIIVKP